MLAFDTQNRGDQSCEPMRLLRAAQDVLERDGFHLLAAQVETIIGLLPAPAFAGAPDPPG